MSRTKPNATTLIAAIRRCCSKKLLISDHVATTALVPIKTISNQGWDSHVKLPIAPKVTSSGTAIQCKAHSVEAQKPTKSK
ncbi:MAG: hypothetical protein SFU99_16095 [Saprospiraceae bacterium]|nr:hypothetical protein [Saprospiraceae bacterium]